MKIKEIYFWFQPKAANVLGAVNKPLSSAGKQSQSKSSRMETVSNASSSSNPSSPGRIKGRLVDNKGALIFQVFVMETLNISIMLFI